VEVILFLTLVFGGFVGAFFLVSSKQEMWGGVVIFVTSIVLFFSFMGFKAINGTQIERAEKYLAINKDGFSQKTKGVKHQFVYSFNVGKSRTLY
jgi:hypothetical protein